MTKTFLPLAILSAAVCAGCFSVNMPESTARQTQTFDFRVNNPEKVFPDTVCVALFESSSSAKNKMLIRNGIDVRTYEFAKWAQPPSAMMTHLFRAGAIPVYNAPLELKGNIINFLYDEKEKQIVLDVSYALVERATGKILWSETMLTHISAGDKDTPEELAEVMEKAAFTQRDAVSSKVAEIIKKIQPEGNNGKK